MIVLECSMYIHPLLPSKFREGPWSKKNPLSTFLDTEIFFAHNFFAVVNQKYEAEILTEYVILGNSGILKCSIPSFVADFVQVESWISNDGVSHSVSEKNNYGIDSSSLPT